MKEPKVKKVTRILPCPSYDIERVESWLQDMAKEGLLLDTRSPFGTAFLRFIPGTPQTLRYRLEPKPKGADPGDPPAEARELAQEYGWAFVCPFHDFYIYRTAQPDAPEMNTDLAVQAASLKRLKRQLVFHLLLQLWIIGDTLLNFGREPYRYIVTFGAIYAALFLLFFVGVLVYDLLRIVSIFRLQRRLRKQIPMEHEKPWKPHAAFHIGVRFSWFFASFLAFAVLLSACAKAASVGKPATVDYPSDPPFATIADLYPGSTLTSAGLDGSYNRYQQTSSNCAPLILDWREFVNIQTADGQDMGSATMIVQYYETAAPWMARGLADDFLRGDQRNYSDKITMLPAPDLGLDHVVVYEEFSPSIIIQHGNIMVKATILDEALLYQWAEWMAQYLKSA